MSEPAKRRLFDSVDPTFDDSIPGQPKTPADFFKSFRPAFERNGHFSVRRPVPTLGDESTPRPVVEKFYEFWLRFESWRSFDLKLDIPENVENRDERRYLEKQAKSERVKLKKEETARVLRFVETALKYDPRVQRWKEEERAEKDAKKKAKEDAVRRVEEEKERLIKEEQDRVAKEEEERRQKAALDKQAREARKKEMKQARKLVRAEVESRMEAGTRRAKLMVNVEILFQRASDEQVDTLNQLRGDVMACATADDLVTMVTARVQGQPWERPEGFVMPELTTALAAAPTPAPAVPAVPVVVAATAATKAAPVIATPPPTPPPAAAAVARPWTEEECKFLIKAVKQFPGGIQDRWNTIAEYVAKHASQPRRTAQDVIEKSKHGQSNIIIGGGTGGVGGIRRDSPPSIVAGVTAKVANMTTADTTTTTNATTPAMVEWTADEQKTLEAALKACPPSLGAERWDKVAAMVPGRSKKEVVARVKDLVELTKKKLVK